jgi:3-oxoacyl-[acyl-carrier protein] reductase
MAIEVRGKTIVITGASSGIGAATARACGAAGMRVVAHGRRADRLASVVRDVESAGGSAHAVTGDVLDPGSATQLLDAAERHFGTVDAVFANAGYGIRRAFTDETEDEAERLWRVNYFASARLAREAARRWIAADRGGHLLLCSSCLARFAIPLHGSYAGTKAAQAAICAAMRHELAPHRIHVSSVHPVATATEFFAQMTGEPAASTPDHAPGRFVQTPETVARAVLRCLEKPRPEVWTSFTVRFAAGLFTVFPRFGHFMVERQTRKELTEYQRHSAPPASRGERADGAERP